MKGWNIIGLLKRGDRSGISMHVFKAALLLVLLVLGMMVNAGPAVADALTDSEKSQVQEAVDNMGIGDVQSDFNVPVPMTKVENPVGYDCNLWITALHHKNPVAGTNSIKRPTILVATGYHRDIIGTMFSVIGFLPYDYNIVVLDMRGTGSAEGVWDPLSPIEAYDVAYLIDKWIPSQPWSDGKVGMVGGSYMGIIQYLAAGLVEKDANDVPVHLKAIAPLSAYNDVWKDIVMHGGNFDLEFMAIWILLTDMISIFPPDLLLGGASAPGFNMTDVENAFKIWGQHFNQLGVPLQWIMNPAQLKKNDWYETKSPMIYWPDKPAGGWHFAGMPAQVGGGVIPSKLPVFTATGWFDIFERGSLMNWEYGLKNHASGDKCMIVGPWYHIEAAFMYTGVNGLGLLGKNSLFTWDILRRWMDWRIKGKPDPFMQQYPVLLYVLGAEKWRAEKSWPLTRLSNQTYYLSKARPSLIFGDWFGLANASNNYKLVPSVTGTDYNNYILGVKKPKADPVLYHSPESLNGLTSRSAQRWFGFSPLTAVTNISKYVMKIDLDPLLPWEDERNDETGVLTFTTEPLASDMEISGPLKLTFWAKTKFTGPATQAAIDAFMAQMKSQFDVGVDDNAILGMADRKDVQWVIEVNDVFPNGRARNITSGWLSAAFRPYNPSNPTQVDPNYKAFDPFYSYPEKNPSPIAEDTIYQYVVEIWPATNVFKKGHRIRLSISGSDFPHLFPVLRPSQNTIVIDETHQAKLDFKVANNTGEGTVWKWIDGNVGDYMLTHKN
ncbi:MAG TPA: CocE/NonD family hydrolase [Smithella sp.]|nr:CocE/NonD family hydrolase [Smithella sp.]HOG91594.1 CocE/NonD family hydrolase [Smithella sp.]